MMFSSSSIQKAADQRTFEIVSINGQHFTATSGRIKATFTVAPGDSVWIGKKFIAAQGHRINK